MLFTAAARTPLVRRRLCSHGSNSSQQQRLLLSFKQQPLRSMSQHQEPLFLQHRHKSSASAVVDEVVEFPDHGESSKLSSSSSTKPVLLNSKEHAVGYLSKVLNARVYDAAIETELQHAKNLSAVSIRLGRRTTIGA